MVDMLTRAESVSWRKVVFATLAALFVMYAICMVRIVCRPVYYWDNEFPDIGIIGGDVGPTTIYTSSRFFGGSEDVIPAVTNEFLLPTQYDNVVPPIIPITPVSTEKLYLIAP